MLTNINATSLDQSTFIKTPLSLVGLGQGRAIDSVFVSTVFVICLREKTFLNVVHADAIQCSVQLSFFKSFPVHSC